MSCMSRTSVNIIPSRLTEARQARAYNISQLSELVGVTRQAMSKYEQGTANPSERVLLALSEVLNFPFDFFYKKDTIFSSQPSTAFFRSLKSSEANVRSMINVKCDWTNEVYEYLNQYLSLPILNLPILDFLLKNDLNEDTIESIALLLRKHWGIGDGPIDNLTYVMEKNGFIISSSEIGAEKVDACSKIINGKPIVFVGKKLKTACRSRFSLAHELGHMILHGYITNEDLNDTKVLNKIEKEANRFASAFLLPKDQFVGDIRSLSLDYFILLKKKWKVSVAAMIYRCQDLGILDENQVLLLRKQISFKKWIREEPLDKELPLERPKLLKTAISIMLDNNIVSVTELLDRFKWSLNDLSDITSCEPSMFKPKNRIDIPLRTI